MWADLLAVLPVNAQRILVAGQADESFTRLKETFALRNPEASWSAWDETVSPNEHNILAIDTLILDIDWLLIDSKGNSRFKKIDLLLQHPGGFAQSDQDSLAVIGIYRNVHFWLDINAQFGGRMGSAAVARSGRDFVLSWLRSRRIEPLKVHKIARQENQLSFEAWLKAAGPLLTHLEVSEDDARDRHAHEVEIVRARGQEKEKNRQQPRLVVAMLAMAPDFAEVRTKLPLAALQTRVDIEVVYMERKGSIPSLPVDQPKVLIVQRQLPDSESSWAETVDRLHHKGWAVIAEWDDHPDLFAASVRANFDKVPWGSVRLADAVQTSTNTLAQVIREVRRDIAKSKPRSAFEEVMVFENQLLELPQERPGSARFRVQGRGDPSLMVFFGALNRTTEGIALMQSINPVLEQFEHVGITVVHDQKVFEAVSTSRKHFLQRLSYSDYHRCLSSCDIALLPLADSLPNRCKSDLKWVECGAHQVVCIASPTVYSDSIEDGKTGLIASDFGAFAKQLEWLIRHPEALLQMGDFARARIAQTRLLAPGLEARIRWYESVWISSVMG